MLAGAWPAELVGVAQVDLIEGKNTQAVGFAISAISIARISVVIGC